MTCWPQHTILRLNFAFNFYRFTRGRQDHYLEQTITQLKDRLKIELSRRPFHRQRWRIERLGVPVVQINTKVAATWMRKW